MRPAALILVAALALSLSACGSSRKTVVVNPQPGSTTVIDADGHTRVIDRDR